MVASRQVEIPFYWGVGRQRGRGMDALAQVIGRTAIPFLLKNSIPVAKRVGADMLYFAVQEVADGVSGKKKFQDSCKECVKTLHEKNW